MNEQRVQAMGYMLWVDERTNMPDQPPTGFNTGTPAPTGTNTGTPAPTGENKANAPKPPGWRHVFIELVKSFAMQPGQTPEMMEKLLPAIERFTDKLLKDYPGYIPGVDK